VLQISSYWREGEALAIDWSPGRPVAEHLRAARAVSGRQGLAAALAGLVPERLARHLAGEAAGPLAALGNAAIDRTAAGLHGFPLRPLGTEGYRTAEVTLGGVATEALDARTMQARAVPGLYFIGEVVDITGWLGGYNFQWAWSSAWAAGQAV
jgi:predicted Rossmann fold flavoprotein